MSDSLFTMVDDGRFLPTGFSRGPWSPHALHGGPTSILIAREAERVLAASGRDAQVPVRLTVDLERPVPLTPLTVRAEVVRPGNKVQVAEVTVHDESGARLARGSVLAIRRQRLDLPEDAAADEDPIPSPGDDRMVGPGWSFPESPQAYHQDATEHRPVRGSLGEPGPTTDWIRLLVDVLPGEAPSPFQRIAAASDFLNGVSWFLSPQDWTFINPDLTITIHRLPVGEWVAIDAVTRVDVDGTGTAEADLHDEHGRLGRAVQTLLIEPR